MAQGEVLQVPKRRGGLRPVTIIDFPARVLYRALTALLEPRLLPLDRSYEAKRVVEQAPSQHLGVTHIVRADTAAFYDFVDHRPLEEELVAQTGDAGAAEALSQFLEGAMGRDFGLPQVLHPSDVLSESFIDIVERRMLRLQFPTWRFNDDFYLAGVGWAAANRALEALDREVRRVGLTLNENKTFLLRADHYLEWLGRPERLWNEMTENVEFDLRAVGSYSDGDAESEVPDDAIVAAAATAVLQAAVPGLEVEDRLQAEVNRQLAGVSLFALQTTESLNGAQFVQQLISLAPQLTHQVCRYLVSITPENEDLIQLLYEQIFSHREIYLSPWQALWLFEPIRKMTHLPSGGHEWIASHLASAYPDAVRGRAALTLAEKDEVTESVLAELYGSLGPSSTPDVVLAFAYVADGRSATLRAVRGDNPMNAWIIDAVGDGTARQDH